MLMDRQTNTWNYTNFERNLAMMVIYLPVKFEFDWTNRFRVTVRKHLTLTDFQLESGNGNVDGQTSTSSDIVYIAVGYTSDDINLAYTCRWVR